MSLQRVFRSLWCVSQMRRSKLLALGMLVFCGGRNRGLFIAPSLHKVVRVFSKIYSKSALGWRTGPVWYTTGSRIGTSPLRSWLEPFLSDWHRTGPVHHRITTWHLIVELINVRQRAIGAKVCCTTGPLTVYGLVNFIIKFLKPSSSYGGRPVHLRTRPCTSPPKAFLLGSPRTRSGDAQIAQLKSFLAQSSSIRLGFFWEIFYAWDKHN